MNQLSVNDLVDIIETRQNANIRYSFILESKLYEAQLEDIEKTNHEVSLNFLQGDLKIILNAETVVLSSFKNQYEILSNGEYIGSLTLEREKQRQ